MVGCRFELPIGSCVNYAIVGIISYRTGVGNITSTLFSFRAGIQN